MLTVTQAAERAGVSKGLVYRWVMEMRLPHFRLGASGKRGKIGIDPADLDDFLEGLKVGPPAAPPRPREPRPQAAFKHIRLL